jgi:hypothetical protein
MHCKFCLYLFFLIQNPCFSTSFANLEPDFQSGHLCRAYDFSKKKTIFFRNKILQKIQEARNFFPSFLSKVHSDKVWDIGPMISTKKKPIFFSQQIFDTVTFHGNFWQMDFLIKTPTSIQIQNILMKV